MLAVNADGQVQPPSGGPTEEILECKLCWSEFGSDPVEALVCGHVFHTDCIHQWMDVSGKAKAECCPYKCHQTMVVQVPAKDEPTRRRRTSNSDSAVLPLQTPRPCARCNLEPIDTVWRPFWRAPFDTEERICGACWLVRRVRRRRRRRRRQYAPSDSAVLPPRSILQGVASAAPVSTESQVEDTEDPWELQRLHDAWLAKEFFYKKNIITSTDQKNVQIAERF